MFSGKKGKEIYERFLVIPCKHVVKKEEQDPELIDKMLGEKEYIVSLCIQHLIDLRNYEKQNKGIKRFLYIMEHTKPVTAWECDNSFCTDALDV